MAVNSQNAYCAIPAGVAAAGLGRLTRARPADNLGILRQMRHLGAR